MGFVLRLLLVLLAVATSGAPQVLAGTRYDPCCEDERSSVPDCPPFASCACCPAGSSLPLVHGDVRPALVWAQMVAVSAPEPVVSARQSDIYHPPRA